MTILQNIFYQIFEESVSIKISPCQNFVLYGTLFTWEPVVECSVAWDYLKSQPRYSADYQLVNTEAISASHEALGVVMVS